VEEEEPAVEYELHVTAQDYLPGVKCKPTFYLESVPGMEANMTYAVSIDEGTFASLWGDSYAPDFSCSLRFALLDEEGNVLAQSARYDVLYGTPDPVEPEETIVLSPTGSLGSEQVLVDEMNDEEVSFGMDVTTVVTNENGVTETTYESIAESVTVYTSPEVVTAQEEPVLYVSVPDGYVQGGSYDQPLTFVLSGIPEGSQDYVYIVDDGNGFTQLIGSSYTASEVGSHRLVFGILDLRTNAIVGE